MTPMEAARKGSNEIYFAVISTTVTLAAVFLPILFLGGITGKLFNEFAIVVAGSVLISAFVALTLVAYDECLFVKADASHRLALPKNRTMFFKV